MSDRTDQAMGDAEAAVEALPLRHWSISQLSHEFNMARETVARRLREASVEPDSERRGFPVYRMRFAAPALFGAMRHVPQPGDPEFDPDVHLDPKARKDWYQGDTEKRKGLVEKGQLVPAAEVRAELAGVIKAVTQMLDTLGDVLERDCQLSPDAVERVEREVDVVRTDLAGRLESDAEETAAA